MAGLILPYNGLLKGGAKGIEIVTSPITQAEGGASEIHNITFPAYSAGDMVVIAVANREGQDYDLDGVGWTLKVQGPTTTRGDLGVFYKTMNGTEGSSITLELDIVDEITTLAFTLANVGSVSSAVRSADEQDPNPPSHTSAVSGEKFWLAIAGKRGATSISAYPSGWDEIRTFRASTETTGMSGIMCAGLFSTDLTEDPGIFNVNSSGGSKSEAMTAATIAFEL